jgi:hypothetical protein
MNRTHALSALLLAATLAACAGADGGPIGTGITTSVVGNVVDVADAGGTSQGLPPVTVSIDEAPELETTTDAEGNFALDGDFAGAVTLRFRTPDYAVTQPVDVPSGAVLVLSDLELSPGGVEAQAGRQIGFVGRVQAVDCAAGVLVVADRREPPNEFRVTLLPETIVQRRGGEPASCEDVAPGDQLGIDGVVTLRAGRVVTALRVVLAAEPAPPDPVREVPFSGRVAAIACARGALTLAGDEARTRLLLSAGTSLTRRDGTPLACEDLRLGDQATGLGRVRLARPGTIEATTVVVTPASRPGVELRVAGFVTLVDCTAGTFELADGDAVLLVHLTPDTVIEPPLACRDIAPGDRLTGVVRVREDERGAVDAVLLRFRRATARDARVP